jgi:hypothetical protein
LLQLASVLPADVLRAQEIVAWFGMGGLLSWMVCWGAG